MKHIGRSQLIGAAAAIVLASGGLAAGILLGRKHPTSPTSAATAAPTLSTDQVIGKVGRLYELPAGETPTVARIQDTAKLPRGQAFYAKAQNGDYVLVYTRAKLALLYRPDGDKLINAAAVTPETAPAK